MKLSYKVALILYFGLFLVVLWTGLFVLPLVDSLGVDFATKGHFNPTFWTILRVAAIFLLSIIPATIFLWALLMRIVIKPVITLEAVTKIIAQGNLGKTVDIKTSDEVGLLSGHVNQIIKNLVTAYQNMANSLLEVKEKRDLLATNLEQLKAAKAQDEALLTSIGDGVVAISPLGKIIFANKSTQLIMGWKIEEMVGQPWEAYLHAYKHIDGEKENLEEQPVARALSSGLRQKLDCYFLRKDQSGFPADVNLSPILINNNINGAILVFRDITIEKQIDRMKTEFISLASHQLRTPLSAIRWFTELLLEGTGGDLNNDQKELAQNISISTLRMIELVNSLLNISRIESGRIIVDPEPTDLAELVKGILTELQVKINERQQHLVVSVHEALPKINVDPKLIRQVYLNLLTNAIKYTPKGGQVEVFISKKGNEIISQISDNGFGIPESQKEKVFQKFFRAENVIKIETDGNGLGLYLVKAIIESSNGRIWFESTEGKGTTFWFSLPLFGMQARKGEVTLDS